MCFHFYFCFLSWYCNRNYKFCNWIKILVITAGVKNYKSIIINKKKKRQEKIVLLPKSELNSIEFLISKALIDSNISHDEFVLLKDLLKEFYDMKKEIKNFIDK